ncbi:MAG: hypothetical protein A3F21_03480 [Candidatus Portnoybacteria bacterium RIFCSPLOWO2_01_FULL_38_39]|uniref:Uncharacterized protein n=1 Tax=Candidatus Portnoybacteria bacterium RIFCSPLOWO2_01_FULL_43_11 TaxID=1802000 RepID=A0A1G2FMV3_9BACT|nr:MAG: hypothetical protein A3F21_03480 [Candidatus Portnoybacteria bacterium RIFCSPLOWO2_01_FULL_38_39]OGZ38841.1 MAG: hypothetical protein A3A94_02290 [Candidatus Portnoybacteria bacterium RIFCSPLOWO2_01_FULL_43_11]
MFFRRKVKCFKVKKGQIINPADISIPYGPAVNLIGPPGDQELVVIGRRKEIKNFLKQHQKLIEV